MIKLLSFQKDTFKVHELERVYSQHFSFLWVYEGKIKFELRDEESFVLNRGRGLLIYPETTFSCKIKTNKAMVSVHKFWFTIESTQGMKWPFYHFANLKDGGEALLQSNHNIESMLQRCVQLSSDLYVNEEKALHSFLLMSILTEIYLLRQYHRNRRGDIFADLVQMVLSKLNHPWSIQEMAEFCKMPESTFRIKFKERFGESPIRYIIKLKMNEAIKLLQNTSLPIYKISEILGFECKHHFYNTFKKNYDMSPRVFRETSLGRLKV